MSTENCPSSDFLLGCKIDLKVMKNKRNLTSNGKSDSKLRKNIGLTRAYNELFSTNTYEKNFDSVQSVGGSVS